MRKILHTLAPLALLASLVTTPLLADATSTPVELGSDGTIYRLWSGTFGELFGPENTALPADAPVLALDVVAPGQALARQVVPGTEGPEAESSAALLYDRTSDSVHLVWNSRTIGSPTVSNLELRSLAAAGWSELIELSGRSQTDKSALRLALTADDFAVTVDGVETHIPRRVLHLVWIEVVADGPHAFYSPVVFANGRYLGWNPVVALDELAMPGPALTLAPPVSVALRAAPTLVATATGRVSASFVHSQSNHLVTVDMQALPGELGELAEMARGHIVEIATTLGPEGRPELGALARGHIVEIARNFHLSAANYIGDRTGELLAAADSSIDAATLGEMARGHIVERAREILASGLANRCAAEEFLLEIQPFDPAAAGPESAFSHFFVMRRVARWEIPSDLVAPDARILVSADGNRATVAWSDESHLYYREVSSDSQWSPVRDLDLTQIPLAEAWDAVVRRASGL